MVCHYGTLALWHFGTMAARSLALNKFNQRTKLRKFCASNYLIRCHLPGQNKRSFSRLIWQRGRLFDLWPGWTKARWFSRVLRLQIRAHLIKVLFVLFLLVSLSFFYCLRISPQSLFIYLLWFMYYFFFCFCLFLHSHNSQRTKYEAQIASFFYLLFFYYFLDSHFFCSLRWRQDAKEKFKKIDIMQNRKKKWQ